MSLTHPTLNGWELGVQQRLSALEDSSTLWSQDVAPPVYMQHEELQAHVLAMHRHLSGSALDITTWNYHKMSKVVITYLALDVTLKPVHQTRY